MTAVGADHDGPAHETEHQRADLPQLKQEHQRRSLFVRSLPTNVTSERLAQFFSQSFPIKHATVVVDPVTHTSKGFGFVTFADTEDARSAKETFNKSTFEGQTINVETAEPRHRRNKDGEAPRPAEDVSGSSRHKPQSQPVSKLIVRNLPWSFKHPDQLAALFRNYGKIKHTTLPKKQPGLSPGYGFVILRGRKNAEKALESINGKEIEGRTLAVDWAIEKDAWDSLQNSTKTLETDDQASSSLDEEENDPNLVAPDATKQMYEVDSIQNIANISDIEDSSSQIEREETQQESRSTTSLGDNPSTLFVRNLSFETTDESLQAHFRQFGPVRYARIVLDHATGWTKGTGFVCFYEERDANSCLQACPRTQASKDQMISSTKGTSPFSQKQSLLEDPSTDPQGSYTMDGRILQISKAVDRTEAARLTFAGANLRDVRDKDKRKLYLLSEGTIPAGSALYNELPPSDIRMREDSAKQRQTLVRSNPTLHLSLTRLSVRNIPRNVTSTELKALAREAVVGFAKDVKAGLRNPLSKEEEARGGDSMRKSEKNRKLKGKGIVKQAKIVFEGREGSKVTENSGAGRSRGYGFIEYSSHRWALMGLRWLNGHVVNPNQSSLDNHDRKKRLIVEFAIENAQVVGRRMEKEAKARERSRLVQEEQRKGSIAPLVPKGLSRDQLMAKTRKGSKQKQDTLSTSSPKSGAISSEAAGRDNVKGAARQRIIGKKRMLRKARRGG